MFCPGYGTDLQSFDANGDRYDDLTCHRSIGEVAISESHIIEKGKKTMTYSDLNVYRLYTNNLSKFEFIGKVLLRIKRLDLSEIGTNKLK